MKGTMSKNVFRVGGVYRTLGDTVGYKLDFQDNFFGTYYEIGEIFTYVGEGEGSSRIFIHEDGLLMCFQSKENFDEL